MSDGWRFLLGALIGVLTARLYLELDVWSRYAAWKQRRWERSVEVWRGMLREAITEDDEVGQVIAERGVTRALVKVHKWRRRAHGRVA